MECECKLSGTKILNSEVIEFEDADSSFDVARIVACSLCHKFWLNIIYEAPQFTDSTHWYSALLPDNFDSKNFYASIENVNQVFKNSQICFRKGIARGSKPEKFSGLPKRLA